MINIQRLPVAGMVLFALISAGTAIWLHSTSAGARQDGLPEHRDTVLIRCSTGGSNFSVSAYQGSTVAPAQRSSNCAENIAILAREGFTVCNIGHYDDTNAGYAVFFMIR